MWFVEVLLVYSLVYTGWWRWRWRAPAPARPTPLRGRTLVATAIAISVATCAICPLFPLASGEIGQSHLWQWPQYVAMFGLGVAAAQRGWLNPVPDALRPG